MIAEWTRRSLRNLIDGRDSLKKRKSTSVKEGLLRSDVEGLRMKWVSGTKHFIAQYHPTWQIVVFCEFCNLAL